MSLRDSFINAPGPDEELVEVNGESVLVKGMNVAGFERYVRALGTGNVTVTLLLECVYDPTTRKPLFGPADAEFLASKPIELFTDLLIAARRLSGLTESDEEVDAGLKATGSDDSSSS